MARIDLNQANGWIPEEQGSTALTTVSAVSAVERLARRENMTSETKAVPRFLGDEVDVVAEGADIPEANVTLDDVVLQARKFAKLYRISEEDMNDSLVNVLDAFKASWADSFARKLDNACLGVTAAANGTTVPFTSVYADVVANAAGNHTATAAGAAVTFEEISNAIGALEAGNYFSESDLIVIAHPAMAANLRNLKDSAGTRVVSEPLNGTPGSIFGKPLVYSTGARTSAVATDSPTGNPLLIAGNRKHLILGVRSGPESQVSEDALFKSDEVYLKVRARRGFAVGRPEAFAIVEKTA